MAIVTSGSKFLGVSSSIITTEKRSDHHNGKQEYWTIEDINQTIATGTANTLAHYNASGGLSEAGEVTIDTSGNITSTAAITSGTFSLGALNMAPASSGASGVVGAILVDAGYIYICTATDTWKRAALASW